MLSPCSVRVYGVFTMISLFLVHTYRYKIYWSCSLIVSQYSAVDDREKTGYLYLRVNQIFYENFSVIYSGGSKYLCSKYMWWYWERVEIYRGITKKLSHALVRSVGDSFFLFHVNDFIDNIDRISSPRQYAMIFLVV